LLPCRRSPSTATSFPVILQTTAQGDVAPGAPRSGFQSSVPLRNVTPSRQLKTKYLIISALLIITYSVLSKTDGTLPVCVIGR
jgi:hypothetical protein